jgi:hypothetical protein
VDTNQREQSTWLSELPEVRRAGMRRRFGISLSTKHRGRGGAEEENAYDVGDNAAIATAWPIQRS